MCVCVVCGCVGVWVCGCVGGILCSYCRCLAKHANHHKSFYISNTHFIAVFHFSSLLPARQIPPHPVVLTS